MGVATEKLYPARMAHQLALSEIVDPNGIKTSVGTSTSAQEYTGAALNGALMSLADWRLPRGVSVTTSVSAGRYNITDPIVFTGPNWDGVETTASVYLTDTDGGETVSCGIEQGILKPTKVNVPKQLLAGGAFEFGVRDIVLDYADDSRDRPAFGRQIRHGSTGDIRLGYDGDDAPSDPTALSRYRGLIRGADGERHDVFFGRVYGSGTTSDPVTVYI